MTTTNLSELQALWRDERAKCITGSDVAALFGMGMFGKSPMTVYMAKVSPVDGTYDSPDKKRKWGLLHEHNLALAFEAKHPELKLIRPGIAGFARATKCPWVGVSPDGIAVRRDDPKKAVAYWEAKSTEIFFRHQWGDEDTDEIPTGYLLQTAHGMMVFDLRPQFPLAHLDPTAASLSDLDYSGIDRAYVSTLIGQGEDRKYVIMRNAIMEDKILKRESKFWNEHVLGGVPPALDTSDATSRYLRELFPSHRTEAVAEASDLQELMLVAYFAEKKLHEEHEKAMELVKNQLIKEIGDNSGIVGRCGRVSFKGSLRATTKWKELAIEAKIPDALIEKYTTQTVVRNFRGTPAKVSADKEE